MHTYNNFCFHDRILQYNHACLFIWIFEIAEVLLILFSLCSCHRFYYLQERLPSKAQILKLVEADACPKIGRNWKYFTETIGVVFTKSLALMDM